MLHITAEKKTFSGETAIMRIDGTISDSSQIFFLMWKWLSPGQYKPVYKSELKTAVKGKQRWN